MRNSEQRYLIAQYASDVRRMELRNIGVILIAAGLRECRFLPENQATQFVNNLDVYRRWVQYWNACIYSDAIADPKKTPIDESAFISELLETQDGNYLLFNAGMLTERLEQAEVSSAVEFLFDELVSTKRATAQIEDRDSLTSTADRVIAKSGIETLPTFKINYSVPCKVFGVNEEFSFNYAVADEEPSLFHRVKIGQQSVTSASLMFHSVIESKACEKERCVALINLEAESEGNAQRQHLRMLRRVSTVVDIGDETTAVETIKRIAKAA